MGSGLITLFKSFREAGLMTPEVKEGTNYVKCILPRIHSNEIPPDIGELILSMFKFSDEISRADIIEKLKIPRTTIGRELNQLVESGKLKRIGKGPKQRYTLFK